MTDRQVDRKKKKKKKHTQEEQEENYFPPRDPPEASPANMLGSIQCRNNTASSGPAPLHAEEQQEEEQEEGGGNHAHSERNYPLVTADAAAAARTNNQLIKLGKKKKKRRSPTSPRAITLARVHTHAPVCREGGAGTRPLGRRVLDHTRARAHRGSSVPV